MSASLPSGHSFLSQKSMEEKIRFKGFPKEKQTWDFPVIINGWVHKLSGAEFKVLWYIVRHTFGWQKTTDTISYKQFKLGIKKKTGEVLDGGTGLGTRSIVRALKSLESYGFIKSEKTRYKGRQGITKYSVIFENTECQKKNQDCSQKENQTECQKEKETIPNKKTIPNINNSNASVAVKKPNLINPLIDYFKIINPSYKKFFSNKTQRSAVERLLKQHGVDKVKAMIDFSAQIRGERYAPVITTPLQLEDKLAQLINYKLKENKNPLIGIVS